VSAFLTAIVATISTGISSFLSHRFYDEEGKVHALILSFVFSSHSKKFAVLIFVCSFVTLSCSTTVLSITSICSHMYDYTSLSYFQLSCLVAEHTSIYATEFPTEQSTHWFAIDAAEPAAECTTHDASILSTDVTSIDATFESAN
jgi:hypothetical protein